MQKEFFTLVLQKILSPDFGMFLEDDESHSIWFRDYVSAGWVCALGHSIWFRDLG